MTLELNGSRAPRTLPARSAAFVPACMAVCLAACSPGSERTASAKSRELVVTRGDVEDIVLMTGTLQSVDSVSIAAPRPQRWTWLTVRHMEVEGTRVSAGQVVLEFDNSEFVSQLEELELAALEAENRLTRERANNAVLEIDKAIEVQVTENLLAKAKISADVPADIMSQREYQEKQLLLEQSRVAFAKAKDELVAHRQAAALSEDIERIALETARREIESAKQEIDAFSVRAPRDGILIIKENVREDRKVKVGDTVFPGMPVLELPNLDRMYVEGALSDVDDGSVAPGMKVTCVLDAFSDLAFDGRVEDVSPVAQAEEKDSLRRAFKVRVSLERTDSERMRPGMSVKLMVHARRAEGALIAPRAGLDVSRSLAFPASGGHTDVDLDWCTSQACVVRSGLTEGDRLRAGGDR